MANDARVINGRLWTLLPVHSCALTGRKAAFPWAGYCDGERVGFYRTKTQFWEQAEMLTRDMDTAQCRASVEAEMRSSADGARLLDSLRKWSGKRRAF